MNQSKSNILLFEGLAVATTPQIGPLPPLLIAPPPAIVGGALVQTENPILHKDVDLCESFTATAIAVIDMRTNAEDDVVPEHAVEIIRIDTDRALTLAQGAREWDSITQRPSRENVVLPFDL